MIKHALSLLAAGAVVFATPAAAEVVDEKETGFTTRDSAVVEASPYEVWQELIAPARWWNDAHTWSADASNMYISAQANGCFCELLPEAEDAPDGVRRGSARHMTVVLADPPRALRMRGGLGPLQSEPVEGVLTIALSEVDGGTRIVWEYVVGGYMRFEVPVIAKAVDGVMSQQLRGLAAKLGPVEETADEEAGEDTAEPTEDGAADDTSEEEAKPSVDEAFEDLVDNG